MADVQEVTASACESCGLYQTTRCFTKGVSTYWPSTAKVLVVMPSMAASAATNYRSNPAAVYQDPNVEFFCNQLLAAGWGSHEIARTFGFSFGLRCVPSDKSDVTNARLKACGTYLHEDIKRCKPKAMVVFGNQGWLSLGKAANAVRRMRGRAVRHDVLLDEGWPEELDENGEVEFPAEQWTHSTYVFTLSEPAHVRDFPHLKSSTPEFFRRDLVRIHDFLSGEYDPERNPIDDIDLTIAQDADHAIALFDHYAAQPAFAWDIESSYGIHAVDPYSHKFKLLGIALSNHRSSATFIPLLHKDRPLLEDPRVMAAFIRCMEGKAFKIAHNGVAFDAVCLAVAMCIRQRNGGRGIETIVDFDTLLADGLIDENRIHALKTLASYLLKGRERYDDELDKVFEAQGIASTNRDYEKHVPFETLCRYGGADAAVTYELYEEQVKTLRSMPSREPWGDMLGFMMGHQMVDGISSAQVSMNGMLMDVDGIDALRVRAEAEYAAAEAQCRTAGGVLDRYTLKLAGDMLAAGRYYIRDGIVYSTVRDQFQPIYNTGTRTEMLPGGHAELLERQVIYKNGKHKKSKTYTDEDIKPNLSSSKQIGTMCEDMLGVVSPKTTKGGLRSYDQAVLQTLAELDGTGFLTALMEWRRVNKVLSTYVRPLVQGEYTHITDGGQKKTKKGWIRDDGYVHSTYMLCGSDFGQSSKKEEDGGGTVSGRHSARDPNMTNLEKHTDYGKALYSLFISRFMPKGKHLAVNDEHYAYLVREGKAIDSIVRIGEAGGGGIIQVDFSQIELRVFAILIGCQWMLERYRNDADLHGELAAEIFKVALEDVYENDGFLRFCAKSVWFGPIYGEGDAGLHADLTKKGATGPNGRPITLEECGELLERTYARMPEFDAFKEALRAQLDANEWFVQLTGRRRFLPQWSSEDKYTVAKAMRQAVNTAVQGVAGDCTNIAVAMVQAEYKRRGMRALVVNSVHDSLVIDAPSEEMAMAYAIARHIMEKCQPWHGLRAHELPIPLLAEGEMGQTWGTMFALKNESTHEKLVFKLPKEMLAA